MDNGFVIFIRISRIWMITTRGKMTDDPIVFAMKDWISYIVFLLIGLSYNCRHVQTIKFRQKFI